MTSAKAMARVVFGGLVVVSGLSACRSPSPPPNAGGDLASAKAEATALNDGSSSRVDGGSFETPASSKPERDDAPNAVASVAPTPSVRIAINTIEECATLGRFPDASVVADAGPGGPKVVVPWMVDPFGAQGKDTGKAPKNGGVDKEVDLLRAKFRACHGVAKKADPTQSVGLSFSHKPKSGQHEVCVEVTRQEGKEEITRTMAACMMKAIKEWARVPE
jgi:hypothetical protein